MSGEGRTFWWAKDAGWWRRELIVALGEEFGPLGPAVIDWLSCEAKAQNDAGRVKSGPRSLARGVFSDVETVSHVLSRSVTLGLLDDFEERDGRFTCRVSGFQADQERGRAAARKAAQRDRERGDSPANAEDPDDDLGVTGRDMSRSVTPSTPTGQENTEEEQPLVEASLDEEATPPDPDVVRLCRLLATLIVRNDEKAINRVQPDGKRWLTAMRLLIADRGGDVDEVERVLRWSQADPFWQTNILSPTKLREQFTQLLLKSRNGNGHLRPADPARDERRARGAEALRSMLERDAAA